MRPTNLIVIHCSATPNGRRVTVEDIDAWHAKRGFRRDEAWCKRQNFSLKSIGYHYVIYAGGTVVSGRHVDEVGAHVQGFNKKSLGICMVGTDRFDMEQWTSLRHLVAAEVARLNGLPGPADRNGGLTPSKALAVAVTSGMHIVGHRDLSPDQNKNGIVEPFEWLKTCPGFNVADWLKGGMAPLADHLLEA